jgi:sulfoxide reductase heme-binding subunit YedZ
MTDPRLLWWVDRSAGLVSMVLLTLVMVLGVASMGRPGAAIRTRAHTQAMHRQLALLATLLLGVHIGTAVADSFVPLTLLDVVLPFRAAYRPVWIGLGTLAIDVLVAVIATSLLRARMPEATWRRVHLLAYLLWPLAMVHALGSGSDLHTRLVPAVGALCLAAVVVGIGWRVVSGKATAVLRMGALLVTVGTTVAVVTWAFHGPLAAGWAKRALGAP